MTGPCICFVTAGHLRHPDDDRLHLDVAARSWGASVSWCAWDDPRADWAAFDAVVLRSTWDYHRRIDEFLAWVERADRCSSLWNPPGVVAWNAHKRYLIDLEAAGVPIVSTALVEQGTPTALGLVVDRYGWNDVVLKPAISAGARATRRFRDGDAAAERALAEMVEHGDVLVQPYLDTIESRGETSLVVVDGVVLYAVVKMPSDGDFRVQPQYGGYERLADPTSAEVDLAAHAVEVAAGHGDVVYARVDCVTVDGEPQLMELELIEPALYLRHAPTSAARVFVAALLARL
jgi:glutathione synthase/RimK-type ligase-like ATP-grasp enzyme